MEHHFLTNGSIITILKPLFKSIYNALGRDINSATIEECNLMILNCEELKNKINSHQWNKPLLTFIPDAFINNQNFNLSVYEFLILVRGMIILHYDSFNIDYSKNCPPVDNTQIKDTSIKIQNNSLIFTENLYCEYSLDNNKNPIVLFMSSFSLDSCNTNILYIYNVCSDTKNTKKSNRVTKNIFSKMLKIFSSLNVNAQGASNFDFFFLFVEQNNPSFSKAFSLYYNNGFIPIINTIETKNVNILSRMIGCLDPNKICNYNTTSKMLMVKSYNNFYENYFTPVTELNTQVKRGIKFYDSTLAFSYRCYCLLERYFTENILICQEFMENFSELFVIENKENKTIVDKFSNNYFNQIDNYTQLALKNPQSFKFILENVNLFRIISTVNFINKTILNLDNFFNNDRVKISKLKIRVEVNEMITGNLGIKIQFSYIDKVVNFDYDNNGKGYDKNVITDKKVLNYMISTIINNIKKTNLDLGVKNDTIFTFISCSFYFESKIDPSKQMGHAVSFIHDNNNGILYFFDPYLIPDRRIKEHIFTLKILRRFVYEIITVNKRKVSKYDDLSKYTDEKGNNLYCKVQQNFADDPLHSMCVLLSLVPYICLQFVKDFDPKKTKLQLQFYLWFLFFSAIIYRQKKIDGLVQEMEITNYQSNLIIIFPFIFIGVYSIVKDMIEDKIKMGMMLTPDDIDLRDRMSEQNNFLSQNLINVLTDINNVVYDKNEIPSKYL